MDVRTVLCDMPTTVKAYTICKDGYFTVILNQNLTHEQNVESYLHELKHIQNGDFDKRCNVNMIELFAHE